MIVTRLLLLLSIICSGSIQAKEIRYSYFFSDFPPLEYVGEDGQADGILIRAIQRRFDNHDLNIEFVYSSLKRGTGLLHSGAVDLVATVQPTPSSFDTFETIGKPFATIHLAVLRRIDTPAITDMSQLSTVPLSRYAGASFFHLAENYPEALAQRDELDIADMDTAVRLVKAKKIPYFLTYTSSEEGPPCAQCVFDTLESLPVYLTISKFHPLKDKHLDVLNPIFN